MRTFQNSSSWESQFLYIFFSSFVEWKRCFCSAFWFSGSTAIVVKKYSGWPYDSALGPETQIRVKILKKENWIMSLSQRFSWWMSINFTIKSRNGLCVALASNNGSLEKWPDRFQWPMIGKSGPLSMRHKCQMRITN